MVRTVRTVLMDTSYCFLRLFLLMLSNELGVGTLTEQDLQRLCFTVKQSTKRCVGGWQTLQGLLQKSVQKQDYLPKTKCARCSLTIPKSFQKPSDGRFDANF